MEGYDTYETENEQLEKLLSKTINSFLFYIAIIVLDLIRTHEL